MNQLYYDPFLTPEREASTLWYASIHARSASEAYMEACDAGLDALHDPEAVWVDQETNEEWRDNESRSWPEHVRAMDGFRPGLESFVDSPITGPLARARKAWGKAMRAIEALPDPRGSYESNCRGWRSIDSDGTVHRVLGSCCEREPKQCQTWMELGGSR